MVTTAGILEEQDRLIEAERTGIYQHHEAITACEFCAYRACDRTSCADMPAWAKGKNARTRAALDNIMRKEQ